MAKHRRRRPFIRALLNMWREAAYRRVLITLMVLLMLLLALMAFFGVQAYDALTSRTIQLDFKNISELSTQAAYYTNVQSIVNSRQVFGITVPFTQSSYIYSYDGVIKAGIDFSKVTVSVDALKKTVTVSLPKPFITSNDVDEDSLVIYDENKNIFSPLKLTDIQKSRTLMEQEAEQSAVSNGLLEEAEKNAKVLIELFLKSEPTLADYQFVYVDQP